MNDEMEYYRRVFDYKVSYKLEVRLSKLWWFGSGGLKYDFLLVIWVGFFINSKIKVVDLLLFIGVNGYFLVIFNFCWNFLIVFLVENGNCLNRGSF